jgi:hypothetical protein
VIRIDVELVHAARRLITGANVHRVNTLIFQYEQSVAIRNAGGQTIDPMKFEQRLRNCVGEELHWGTPRGKSSDGDASRGSGGEVEWD